MTLANKLTLSRMAIAPVAFLCIWSQRPNLYSAALVLFILATITDWVDGYIARSTHSVSPFGKMVDPLADKVLVIGALIAFVRIPDLHIPAWAVFLIIVRELLIGGLRSLAGAQGKLLAADIGGKVKMVVHSTAVIAILLLLVVWSHWPRALPEWTTILPYWLIVLSMLISVGSGLHYLYRSRALLRKSWDVPKTDLQK